MERRQFIKNSIIASTGSLIIPSIVNGKLSASNVQLGIIGCGGRGTAVITSMSKNANVNIIAMADIFEDRLKAQHPVYNELNAAKGLPAIKPSNMYHGADSYRKLLQNKDVDAVLISSPCYTHPEFLEAAIQAGKHVYCEKPVAVDVVGVKRAQNAAKGITNKSITIGFQIRHASPYVEMVKRVHAGEIGEVINAQLYYLSSRNEKKELGIGNSDTEMKIRNHFHFRAMSGGILLDQGIHMLDVCNWALQDSPISALASGGRNLPDNFGDIWNHYQVIYKYPKNIHVTMQSTQVGNTFGDVCARFIGTKGIAEAHYSGGVFINGENKWDSGVARDESSVTAEQRAAGVFLSSLHDSDKNKGSSFIKSIETGKYINEVNQAAASTFTAILGRQAAEKNAEVSWKAMNEGNEKLDAGLNLNLFK
ncbi:MAG: Gfo/Idh/MocA family oxidoreductase [Chitinophagaceae bacterium]|nr:Gfo/Idh/MocA family oxidoreductase [Chitinophagaceae bacterium]